MQFEDFLRGFFPNADFTKDEQGNYVDPAVQAAYIGWEGMGEISLE